MLTMIDSEDGMAMVLVFVVITIMLTMIASMMAITINQINISEVNADGVQASYIAEAGIENALHIIEDDPMNFTSSPNGTLTSDLTLGYDYEPVQQDDNFYTITSEGTSNGITRSVSVEVEIDDLSAFDNIITAEGDINFDGDNPINISGDKKDKIVANTSNIPTFDFGAYEEVARDNDQFFDDLAEFKSWLTDSHRYISSSGTFQIVELPSGVVYIDSGISEVSDYISLNGASKENPTVLVINGDFDIENSFGGINFGDNVYVIVKGTFKFDGNFPGGRSMLVDGDNVFIYAEGYVTIVSESIKYHGSIMSKKSKKLEEEMKEEDEEEKDKVKGNVTLSNDNWWPELEYDNNLNVRALLPEEQDWVTVHGYQFD
ncbi:hypothetical protein [Selenihalanaerobacter shriftii]|uniref:PilX N-terminal n=1 Tax=Selenihalanaerobacter shriftii TaxID=142842 RepID=A0A1T4P477_9FIRM|nr:hypothetical protein [Selenihalanaerobacter shriftii]SJZ86127.1 hypothetical protein SAMN02745118_02039 [Selenihalanaerobacter shriftii]